MGKHRARLSLQQSELLSVNCVGVLLGVFVLKDVLRANAHNLSPFHSAAAIFKYH